MTSTLTKSIFLSPFFFFSGLSIHTLRGVGSLSYSKKARRGGDIKLRSRKTYCSTIPKPSFTRDQLTSMAFRIEKRERERRRSAVVYISSLVISRLFIRKNSLFISCWPLYTIHICACSTAAEGVLSLSSILQATAVAVAADAVYSSSSSFLLLLGAYCLLLDSTFPTRREILEYIVVVCV